MKFKNPQNNYVEKVSSPLSWLWVLLFGPIYWAIQGVWRHAVVHFVFHDFSITLSYIFPNNDKKYAKYSYYRQCAEKK